MYGQCSYPNQGQGHYLILKKVKVTYSWSMPLSYPDILSYLRSRSPSSAR